MIERQLWDDEKLNIIRPLTRSSCRITFWCLRGIVLFYLSVTSSVKRKTMWLLKVTCNVSVFSPLPYPLRKARAENCRLAGSSRPSASLFACACSSTPLTNSQEKERLLACSLQANWNSGGSKSVACELALPCPRLAFSASSHFLP